MFFKRISWPRSKTGNFYMYLYTNLLIPREDVYNVIVTKLKSKCGGPCEYYNTPNSNKSHFETTPTIRSHINNTWTFFFSSSNSCHLCFFGGHTPGNYCKTHLECTDFTAVNIVNYAQLWWRHSSPSYYSLLARYTTSLFNMIDQLIWMRGKILIGHFKN